MRGEIPTFKVISAEARRCILCRTKLQLLRLHVILILCARGRQCLAGKNVGLIRCQLRRLDAPVEHVCGVWLLREDGAVVVMRPLAFD